MNEIEATLKAPKSEASFHDFEKFERLVEGARSEALAQLVLPMRQR